MKLFYAVLISICALAAVQSAFAEEIVVRVIDVRTGAGLKNCYANVMSGLGDVRIQRQWLSGKWLLTGTDGRARFNITQPPPNFVEAFVDSYECYSCDRPSVVSLDEVLQVGILNGMNGKERQRRALLPSECEEA
ncbi:MAG: hypothetical protein ACRD4E_18185 [Bryobacteraceae bacterium]